MATTKKTPAKKSSTNKRSATKKSTGKAAAKRSPVKKSSASKVRSEEDADNKRQRASAPRAAATNRPSGLRLALQAARELEELTGREVEGVTGVERRDESWVVQVEVLEVSRIPTTTDVLALYEVTVGEAGEVEGYRRVERYVRGSTREDGGR